MTRRPVAAAALLYLVLSFAMFAPGLAPGRTLSASDYLWTATPWDASRPADIPPLGANQELTDSAVQFQPSLETTRKRLPDIPLWDPFTLSGRPLLGDPQSAVFSPFSVPAYVLPFWKSFAVIAALKLFVAALGTFLLGRAVGMRLGGALLAGLVFGFSLWMVTWVSWPHSSVWALLPWLCLLSERCLRRPGLLPFAGLAAVVGLQFVGGHPASSFQVLVVVVPFWVVRAALSRELRERLVVRLLTFAGALTVGVALAGVALFPFVELLGHSNDAAARAAFADFLHQPPRYLLGIALFDYWGHGAASLQFGTGLQERAYYVAALPLMLALAGLLLRPSRERIAVAAVGALALAVSTGLSPVYDLVLALPGLDAANNGRFAILAVLCLAALAGWGLDELSGSRLTRLRGAVVAGTGAVLVALPVAVAAARGEIELGSLGSALGVAWAFATPEADSPGSVRLAALLEWLVLGSAALVLVALSLRGRLAASAFIGLACLLVTVDLFKAGMGYNPAIPVDHAVQPVTPAIRFLQGQAPARFGALQAKAPVNLAYPLPANVAQRYGLYDVRGYVIPTEERYFEIFRTAIAPDPNCYFLFCTQDAPAEPGALRTLGLLGVNHLLQNRADPPLKGLKTAYAGADARVYENPHALPRAFMVDRQVVVADGAAALAAVTSEDFSAREAAVTEKKIPGLPHSAGKGGASSGRVRIADYRAEKVVIDSRSERPGLLVLTDSWFPGWKASVDGKSTPVERVNYVIRGVRVPAGTHRVEFTYEPASVRGGVIVSGVALIVLVVCVGVGIRRRRLRMPHASSTACMFGS